MSEQLPDKRFEQLAKLIGDVLAKRWMQILAKRQATTKRSGRQHATRGKKPNKT